MLSRSHQPRQPGFLIIINKKKRETAAAAFWPDHPDILAGRDLKNGGTWCGVTRGGRFALLTNFRERDPGRVEGAPSRGALPLGFLRGGAGPLEYLRGLDLARHNGFNLVVGDLNEGRAEVAYVTNRSSSSSLNGKTSAATPSSGAAGGGAGTKTASPPPFYPPGTPVLLPPGVYGLSNGVLGDSWCKVDRGVAILKEMLERREFDGGDGGEEENGDSGGDREPPSMTSASSSPAPSSSFPWDALFRSLMGDTSRAPAHRVPDTGIPRYIEERLTPTFVTPFELLLKGGGGGGGGGGGEAATATTPTTREQKNFELKKYGTRSQTALVVFSGGRAALRERRLVSWRERGGATVTAGGEEEEEEGKGAAGAAAAAAGSLPLLPPPFSLECCPIQSEWREVAHEFRVRSLEKKEKRPEGGVEGGESERELVVDEAGECAAAAAADEEGGEDAATELRTSPD